MRTTVDLPNEKIASLRALAAKRGLRGYSELIEEAVDLYLRQVAQAGELEEVIALAGTWSEEEIAELEEAIKSFWQRWEAHGGNRGEVGSRPRGHIGHH
jgi:metal-responsive CopG/Arc/MetJ family transcriptional regulator